MFCFVFLYEYAHDFYCLDLDSGNGLELVQTECFTFFETFSLRCEYFKF